MATDIETSVKLIGKLPEESIKIAESGIKDASTIYQLKKIGYHGFLIGEYFMQHARPELACQQMIKTMKTMMPC